MDDFGNQDEPLSNDELRYCWTTTRGTNGIATHAWQRDVRHAQVSRAVMNGTSLHIAGHLLGLHGAPTRNRDFHTDDTTRSQAAERLEAVIQQELQ